MAIMYILKTVVSILNGQQICQDMSSPDQIWFSINCLQHSSPVVTAVVVIKVSMTLLLSINGPWLVMSLQDMVISSFSFKEQPCLLCMIPFFHRVFHLRLSCSLVPQQFLQLLQSRASFRMNLTTFFLDLYSPIWQPPEMWLIQIEM